MDSSGFHSIHASTPARPSRASRPSLSFAVSSTPFIPKSEDPQRNITLDTESDIEFEEEGAILAARALLSTREYHRVVTQLSGCRSAKAQFLRLYSRYLVCAYPNVENLKMTYEQRLKDGERKSLHTWYAAHGQRPRRYVIVILTKLVKARDHSPQNL
jgi:hypothetical protein